MTLPRASLLVVAAPAEARAVLRGVQADESLATQPWKLHAISSAWDLVVTGIGKSNAAGAAGRFLDPARHDRIISIGVAGALPGSDLHIGQAVAATACVFADEGLQAPDCFLDCAALGFPLADFPGSAVPVDQALLREVAPLTQAQGPIATVSTCSGIDAFAQNVRSRTGAIAECMEGAAVALVAHRLRIPMAELRVISNTTGDRETQIWDLKRALAGLESLARSLASLRSITAI